MKVENCPLMKKDNAIASFYFPSINEFLNIRIVGRNIDVSNEYLVGVWKIKKLKQ